MDAAQQHVHARLTRGERAEAVFHDLLHSGWNPQTANALIASVQGAPGGAPQPVMHAPLHTAPALHGATVAPPTMRAAIILLWINLALSAVLAAWPFLTLDGPRDVLARFFPPVIPYLIAAVLLWVGALVLFLVARHAAKTRGEILPKLKTAASLLIASPIITVIVMGAGLFAFVALGVMCGEATAADCGL